MDSFKELQDSISSALVSTTRSATRLSSADIPFQRSLDPEVGTAIDEHNARLLQLAQRLLQNAAASSGAVGPKLPDVEAIDANWRGIVDVVDSLLEKADTSLDEYTGVVKRLAQGGEQATSAKKTARHANLPNTYPKPQLLFEHVPKNDETGGFRPLLSTKPHAKIPLDECLKTFRDSNGNEQYPHPYQTEIESYEYPASMYQTSEPIAYTPFETTTATFVDTPEAVAEMLAELKSAKEIAIDLEHHDNRSYVGIVCLMQISTRNKDWIVDTLKPWRRRLECLNEVFADPSIVKVLHGAYMDIVWLQRDLGLYVVGLFDTYHAARTLGYPGASLAFLLSKFANFQAQKQYQMADWRVRPLGDELFNYARADTHFLLYIFDCMRNELVERSDFSNPEKDKVTEVLNKSRETALQRYEHPIYDSELGMGAGGWYRLICRTPLQYTPQQFAVFRAVHKWRDDVARAEDESPVYVMPNHSVFSIARTMPDDRTALFSIMPHVSHVVRARVDELLAAIAEAKNVGPDAPDLNDTIKKIEDMKFKGTEEVLPTKSAGEEIPAAPILETTPLVAALDTAPHRASISKFWGGLWSGGSVDYSLPASELGISLALPLPPLTAEVFASDGGPAAVETPADETPQPTFVPKEERPAEDKRSDIFIVKQLGGKRKRGRVESTEEQGENALAAASELEANADEVMLEDDEKARRRREKALRKEAKRLKKQRQAQEAAEQEDEEGEVQEEEEPAFDYASAPSVLRAREAERSQAGGSGKKAREKKREQGFNPYARLADAPRGLPRAQKEKAGKSKTFRS
ncbi:exosome complex exonuclease-like protein Rrp6 [Westerdykella ornata]|uniref:Exosome complex exonuclease-like protein Rrp6 n=1 Tax=Westerdykella ornata TaxID=318751 RepID=A0A6A6JNU3_WESOR|nr:exosome complex exonuclease-like protein Rrp6 [Westerdykella ornata]KAF2278320.1 exosome complex exonuclease-like protein Rrp6 [Westerdykella ornata]